MKKLLTLIALTALTGCASPLGNVSRIFPDGASVAIDEINMQVSMTGSGSIVVKGARWVGTNGFPISANATNSVSTSATSITTRRAQ